MLTVILSLLCQPAFAQSTGVNITNTAHATFTYAGEVSELASNTVSTAVLPLIDISVRAVDVQQGRIDGDRDGFLYSFDVSNPGNARDTYDLLADFTDISDPVAGLWLDNNGDGQLSFGDTRISSSIVTLDAGHTARILVTATAAGNMELRATSLSRDAGAIVVHRSAAAWIAAGQPEAVRAGASLEKSQTVDLRGASRPGSGTLITYNLKAYLPAALDASDIRVTDTIPAGTSYVPGSLTLDGATLSDAVYFTPSTGLIAVALTGAGDQADTLHTIRFQVRVN